MHQNQPSLPISHSGSAIKLSLKETTSNSSPAPNKIELKTSADNKHTPSLNSYTEHLQPATNNQLLDNCNLLSQEYIQQRLQEILKRVLYLKDNVDEEESFKDLGADSILTSELSRSINRELQLSISVTTLYDYFSIRKLANYIVEKFPSTSQSQEDTQLVQPAIEQLENEEKSRSDIEIVAKLKIMETNELSSAFISSHDIAIIGMSGHFPGATDLEVFWENLALGKSLISKIPKERWSIEGFYYTDPERPNKSHSKCGGFLNNIDQFDPLFFNISPAEAEFMDPQQRLFLEECWKVFEDAGYSAESLAE